jgi:hypothetical protein
MVQPLLRRSVPNPRRSRLCHDAEGPVKPMSSTYSDTLSFPFSRRGVAFRLFVTCWLVYALHFATNTVREIYPALSLGDHLSFDVSEYVGFHPDIFEIPGRGAFINNNPGASILGAIPYVVSRPVIDWIVETVQRSRVAAPDAPAQDYKTIYPMAQEFYRKARQMGLDVKFGLGAGVMQAFLMAPFSALSTVVMFYILASLTSLRTGLMLSLLYAFATPVFYRTAQLNQNLLVSHFALLAFAVLWKPWNDSARSLNLTYFIAGLLGGWTVVLDYSGLIVVSSLGLYVCMAHRRESSKRELFGHLCWYGAGAALTMTVLLAYQWLSFGHPLYPAQFYMPAATFTHFGYRGMDWPKLDLLWETAFSLRFGLFVSAPFLLLSLYVPGWFRSHRIIGTPEFIFILTFSLLFFLFCAANQYGRMQFNTGVRHVVPVIPFLFLLVAGVLIRLPTLWAILIGVFSTYWSWCLAMYRDVEQGLGVMESIIHVTFEGLRFPWLTVLKHMGYVPDGVSTIPFFLVLGAILWVVWNSPLQTWKTLRMRFEETTRMMNERG